MGSLQPCPQLCDDAGCRSTSRAPLFATQQPGEFLRQTHPRRLVQTAVMLHAYSIYLHRPCGCICLPACLPTLILTQREVGLGDGPDRSIVFDNFFPSLPNIRARRPPGRKRMGRRSGRGGNMGRLREVIITRFRRHTSMPARDHHRARALEYLSGAGRLDCPDRTVATPLAMYSGLVRNPVSSGLECGWFRILSWPSTP